MPIYLVRAVERGSIIDVATVDTARVAIIKFLDAADQYSRTWVCDHEGHDIVFDELVRRAEEEERNPGTH